MPSPTSLIRLLFLSLLALALLDTPAFAGSRTISLPMSIDYSLLNSLVAQSAFAGADQQALLLHEHDGCRSVVISNPRFFEDGGELFLEMQLHVQHGMGWGGVCLFPVVFDGFLVMNKVPVINPADWSLRFDTRSTQLLAMDRKPGRLVNLAWSMVENHVFDHQQAMRVDLAPPIKELRDFLPMIMPKDQPDLVLEMLASLHPETVLVEPLGLRLNNEIVVPWGLYQEDDVREEPLTEEELELFIAAWEVWDSFLVTIISTLAGKDLDADDRLLLLDVLLRLRHAFLEELENPMPDTDLVRDQFVEIWNLLGPIFRSHLVSTETGSLFGYMAFFSASDALVALDEIGPTLGLDISREGLLRLARLLAEGKDSILEYGPEVLPDLLRTLGIVDHSAIDDSSLSAPGQSWFWGRVSRLFAAPAWASSAGNYSVGRDDQWVFRRSDVYGYLDRIQNLLRKQADETVRESTMSAPYQDMFADIVLATAWQESCFRQFIATGEQVAFLRSYNNTSVGLMQINERVWRGIYDQHKLRWDIVYNARTGTKILDLYLVKYAEPRMRNQEHDWSEDTLAGMLYAMYSGGPGQLGRYLNRLDEGSPYRSDTLFKEKWDWVRQDALNKGSICLVGH